MVSRAELVLDAFINKAVVGVLAFRKLMIGLTRLYSADDWTDTVLFRCC